MFSFSWLKAAKRNSRKIVGQAGKLSFKGTTFLLLERLEDRIVPSALDITGGSLTYTASANTNNNLTITSSGGDYTFQDTAETISLSGGAVAAKWTSNSANSVSGPISSVTTDFTVNLL